VNENEIEEKPKEKSKFKMVQTQVYEKQT